MKSSGIGGQAVLEGVMMRNKSIYAVAVRKPDGEIAVTRGKCRSMAERSLFFRLPIVRGIVAFVESLVLGMRTLTYSASFYEEEEERKESEKDQDKQESREKIQMAITVALSIVVAVAAFMLLPYFLSQMLGKYINSFAALAAIEGLIRVVLFVGYVVAISFMEDIRRTFMYHGAEHKSINCIENGLELTVENVRRQSKHHRRCGTSFLFIVIFLSIIFFMFIHFNNMWLRILSRIVLIPVIAGVSYEFIHWAGNSDSKVVKVLSKPGMFLQMLTTREPDNRMIEVAIASVEEVFDWREYQKRCIAAKKSKAKLQKEDSHRKKTRAELAEEIRLREEENARRANERARKIMERERKEAELEKIAEDAQKRKRRREEMLQETEEEPEEDNLAKLDHYFDSEKGKE